MGSLRHGLFLPSLLTAALLCGWLLAACGTSGDDGNADAAGGDAHAPGVDAQVDVVADVVDPSDASTPDDVAADIAPDTPSAPPMTELPIEATEGYRARQAEYLAGCFEDSSPENDGGLSGQCCRIAGGGTVHTEVIDEAIAFLGERKDTADFKVASLVRMLYLDDLNGRSGLHDTLPADVRERIEESLRTFKYWIHEPGQDKMCYWSENHQILFLAGELLVGQLMRDREFTNDGKTGAEHIAHAEPRILRWLELRGQTGFSEWHSNVYFNEDMPPLVNLVDFAENEEIRTKAAMVLDLLAFDMLNNMYRGNFATTHGRTYPSKLIGQLKDSTADAAWVMTGLGEPRSDANFSASFLSTSPSYVPPPILEAIAADTEERHEHRQHDSFDIDQAEQFGLTYDQDDDIIIWAGMSALAAPEIIEGMAAHLDRHDLWDGFLFGDLPDSMKGLLQGLAGTPALRGMAEEAELVSRGIALQGIDTYTYRSADYQLSGAQDYHPGYWSAQTFMWQATLDRYAYVFTSCPSTLNEDVAQVDIAGEWTGSWQPRVTLHRNVGVIQYRSDEIPQLIKSYLDAEYTHAYFPRSHFDEVREEDSWTFGRKGDGYVALYCSAPTRWAEDVDYDLIADTPVSTWIVELGSATDNGDFDTFVAGILAAPVTVADDAEGQTRYGSPSVGEVVVGWQGPMTVDGEAVDLGPYPRWSNEFSETPFAALRTEITRGAETLELDFEAGTRRLLTPTE